MNSVISVDREARSRRNFFAQAGALVAAAGLVPTVVEAQSGSAGDLEILNFALRLERLENAFYMSGLAKFAATDFANAAFAKNLTPAQVTNSYTYFQTIQQQEMTHVSTITAAIMNMGGTPAAPDCYTFQLYGSNNTILANADSFVSSAMVLENAGVSAYDGSIGMFSTASLITTAATIATVEARHASYLNSLNAVSPFPSAFDTPATQAAVLAAAAPFLASCSTFPPVAVAGPANTTTASNTLQLSSAGSTPPAALRSSVTSGV
jgi:hypothetical protein